MKNPRPTLAEALLLSLCAAILIWKLLLPGFIGMANKKGENSDMVPVKVPVVPQPARVHRVASC